MWLVFKYIFKTLSKNHILNSNFLGFGRHLKAWIYENDGHISTKPIHKTKVFKSSSIHNIKVSFLMFYF